MHAAKCKREDPHGARTAHRAVSDILVAAQKKLADPDLPHKSRETCVPRGVTKVSHCFEVGNKVGDMGAVVVSMSNT